MAGTRLELVSLQSLAASQGVTSSIKERVEEGRQKFFARHVAISVGFITIFTAGDSGFLSTCSDAHIWKGIFSTQDPVSWEHTSGTVSMNQQFSK